MNVSAWLGLAMAGLGALSGTPPLVLVGVLVLLASLLRGLWSRYGLRGVTYERHLAHDRAVWGDEVGLDVTVWNRKLLPLPWLHADDFVPEDLSVRGRTLARSDRPGLALLDNTWSLAWYERVVRHLRIVADRRGVFRFGAVRLRVADLFARETAEEERTLRDELVVRPRSVGVLERLDERATLGERRARHSLFRDPALFAGVRPYQPGDPLRHVHWKATARSGETVVKRFDPSRQRTLLFALDGQTVDGPHWLMTYDEDLLEGLCVAAASLARRALAEGAECGLAAAAYAGTVRPVAWVPPAGGSDQLGRIADTLARISPGASQPFERLLASLPQRIGPDATIVAITGRDPAPFVPVLRRLARSGYGVELVAMGGASRQRAAFARAAGIEAFTATLDRGWRESDALTMRA
ncbi:MAG: DUF58 domain-containing protein [Chloroflexi bacterium]|nr:DUF58 domain-containing protein [Chloroflexota bacterium]